MPERKEEEEEDNDEGGRATAMTAPSSQLEIRTKSALSRPAGRVVVVVVVVVGGGPPTGAPQDLNDQRLGISSG